MECWEQDYLRINFFKIMKDSKSNPTALDINDNTSFYNKRLALPQDLSYALGTISFDKYFNVFSNILKVVKSHSELSEIINHFLFLAYQNHNVTKFSFLESDFNCIMLELKK